MFKMKDDNFPGVVYGAVCPEGNQEHDSLKDQSSIDFSEEITKLRVPDENELFIDPRLMEYPIRLVAQTVDLHNDDT